MACLEGLTFHKSGADPQLTLYITLVKTKLFLSSFINLVRAERYLTVLEPFNKNQSSELCFNSFEPNLNLENIIQMVFNLSISLNNIHV